MAPPDSRRYRPEVHGAVRRAVPVSANRVGLRQIEVSAVANLPMTDRDHAARAAIAALRERYREGSGAILERFRALAGELAASPASPEAIEAIRREAHRVRGTAGTYGFAEASRLAEVLERRCVAWLRDRDAAAPAASEVERFADELARAFDDPTDTSG